MEKNDYAQKFESLKTVTELLLFRDELLKVAEETKWDGDPDSPELNVIQNANYYKQIVQEKVSELISERRQIDTPTLVTKREYFAAMAMQGILAANEKIEYDNYGKTRQQTSKEVAEKSLWMADQLLTALKKGEPI